MKKFILTFLCWCLGSCDVSAQDVMMTRTIAVKTYPDARVTVDTITYRSLDLVTEQFVVQERVAEDTIAVVPFTATTAYHLFSPSIVFPGSWVERMSNGFPVVIGCDTFCMTVPSCDDDACTSRIFSSYEGFPLVPLSAYAARDCAFVPGTKDTNDARVIVEGLGRAGASHLLRVTVYGYALSTVPPQLRSKYDPGYLRVSVTDAYYTRYLAGAPVFGPDGTRVIGIVSGILYCESGEEVVEVRLVITFFT